MVQNLNDSRTSSLGKFNSQGDLISEHSDMGSFEFSARQRSQTERDQRIEKGDGLSACMGGYRPIGKKEK